MTDILMSVKPPYVDMLISGCKTVELRKRAVRAPAGARIRIYATSPRRQVVASARLQAVASEAPDECRTRRRSDSDRGNRARRASLRAERSTGLPSAAVLRVPPRCRTPGGVGGKV